MNDLQIRDRSGVPIRRDGRGDPWGNGHRRLGSGWPMRDGDEVHKVTFEIERCENTVFREMGFDSYSNRGRLVRKCGTVARVDRKKSVGWAESQIRNCDPALAHMLQECRNDRACQGGIGGRAILVCGEDYPYVYIELDPFDGSEIQRGELAAELSWTDFYKSFGLAKERASLENWLRSAVSKEAKDGR
ncbi:MAG: hypothetical protein HQ464_02475 [Planctomycetes bacterium]|nr:hypothetical protein [Planctomycetota bacterium]